jgi:hypothetical protein
MKCLPNARHEKLERGNYVFCYWLAETSPASLGHPDGFSLADDEVDNVCIQLHFDHFLGGSRHRSLEDFYAHGVACHTCEGTTIINGQATFEHESTTVLARTNSIRGDEMGWL